MPKINVINQVLIDFVEKGEILKTELDTTEVLNTFFGNVSKKY